MAAKFVIALCLVAVARGSLLAAPGAAILTRSNPGDTSYSAYSTDIIDPGTPHAPTITTINAAPALGLGAAGLGLGAVGLNGVGLGGVGLGRVGLGGYGLGGYGLGGYGLGGVGLGGYGLGGVGLGAVPALGGLRGAVW